MAKEKNKSSDGYRLLKGKVSKFPLREKPEREKKAKQTRRGKRKKLKSQPLPRGDRIRPGLSTRGYVLEDATMDFSKPPSEQLEQFVYKRKDGEKSKKSMKYKKGGRVRGAGIARKGVRPARML